MLFDLLRNTIYFFIGFFDKVLPLPKHEVIILCYHSIASDGWRFSVSLEQLELQLKHLLSSRAPMTIEELEDYMMGEKRISRPSFIITFDDGYKDLLQTVDLFKRYKIKPAVFVLSRPERANRTELDNKKDFLSLNDIELLQKARWTIGCHSATHANFGALSSSQAHIEIIDAVKELTSKLGTQISYFAYPKGKYSKKIEECVKIAGCSLAFSMDDARISLTTNRLAIPRIGVDGSHGLAEFKSAITSLAIYSRSIIKNWNKH